MILDQLNDSLALIIFQTKMNAKNLSIIVLIPWIIFFVNSLIGNRLFYFGIFPRHIYGLPGVLFAPLLHLNFNHLFFNTIPLVVLSNFILIYGLPYFLEVTLTITLLSGILIWCFSKPGLYIGASALITGYWGLLVSDIYQQGTITAIILGIISLYYFAGIFLGIFPQEKGVSWEGHLFGLLAGIATGFVIYNL